MTEKQRAQSEICQKSVGQRRSIAIIGFGFIGRRHCQSVIKSQSFKLLCIVDPIFDSPETEQSAQVPRFASISAMLAAGLQPDASIVCTPSDTHFATCVELLSAGIHLLVEKPVVTVVCDGNELLRSVRLSGKQLLVGHHRRFNPFINAARHALSAGIIGTPLAVSGLWVTYKPPNYFTEASWRTKRNGGGPIQTNLIHEIDILQYLLGPIVRVYAERTISHRNYEVEEGAAITLRFASGVVGTFILSDASPSTHNLESATGENPNIPKAGKDFYRIFGTDGTLSVGDMKVTKHRLDGEKTWFEPLQESHLVVGDEIPFDEQIEHFSKVIDGVEVPRCSGQDAMNAVIVCNSIKKSLAEEQPISIRVSRL